MSKANQKQSKPRAYIFAAVAVLTVGGGVLSYALTSSQVTNDESNSQSNQVAVNQPKSEDNRNAYASIADSDIQRAVADADILWRPEGYQAVALVHINSIDGGRAYNPVLEAKTIPQTYGKMTVREVYRGDIKAGEQLSYYRVGGIVTYDEYWNSLNKQQQDKILHLNGGKKPAEKSHIELKMSDDINIEVNKDYVVFLTPQVSKDGKSSEYLIGGAQFGLREVKGTGNNVTVLNNETKQWENVSNVVK